MPPSRSADAVPRTAADTLITGLFDVARRETPPRRPDVADYLERGRYVLGLQRPLVLFVEPEIAERVARARERRAPAQPTQLVPLPLEELPFFPMRDRIAAAREAHPLLNVNPVQHTPLQAVVTWSKLALVHQVIRENPFDSERFGWIDFGISHVARTEYPGAERLAPALANKIRLLVARPVQPELLAGDPRQTFALVSRAFAGGLITGNAAALSRLRALYEEQLLAALDAGVAPTADQLLPHAWAREPELFDVYRGDYRYILANYERPRGGGENLLYQLRELRGHGDLATACSVGAQILASHRAGSFVVDPETLCALLEEYFAAAYYLESPRQDSARAVAEYFRELVAKDRAFAAVYARDRELIDRDFAFLGDDFAVQLPSAAARAASPGPAAAAPAPSKPLRSAATPTTTATRGGARICLNMIVKDEAAIIERCLASVLPIVDRYEICDTGSRDNTISIIERFFAEHGIPGEVHRIRFKSFEHARNRALELCRATRAEFDYILLADADMELVVEDADFRRDLTAAAYLVRQRNVISYDNIRLLRRDAPARYVGVTHEVLDVEGAVEQLDAIHYLDHACGSNRPNKLRRDIRLLRAALREEPQNARYLFYLAQSYRDAGQHRQALRYYEQRLAAGGWPEEAWYARYMVARCYRELEDEERFISSSLAAFDARPTRAEPLYQLARYLREQQRYESCRLYCEAGLQIPYPERDRLFIEDYVYRTGFIEELGIAGYYCASPAHKRAGFEACVELMSRRDAPSETRALAKRNASYYAPSADELFGELTRAELAVPCRQGYAALNPSICRHQGALHAVVRTANYTLDKQMRFRIHDAVGVVRTENFILTLDEELAVLSCRPLEDHAVGVERFDFPVRGFEDCRVLSCRGRLWCSCTVRDLNPEGRCEIAILELDDEQRVVGIHPQRSLRPELHQKNWVPLVRDDELYLVYATDPTEVLRFDFDSMRSELVRASVPSHSMEDFRGSSQAIAVPGGWLYLAHQVAHFPPFKRIYLHRFVLLDDDFAVRRVSHPFYFVDKGIEFCAGLVRDEQRGRLLASFGVWDRETLVVALPEDRVLAHLAATPPIEPRAGAPA